MFIQTKNWEAAARAARDPSLSPTQGSATMADRSQYVAAQTRATLLLQTFGDSAGAAPFNPGEGLFAYRARLAKQFQAHSPRCRNIDLTGVGDRNAFEALEDQIYGDAGAEAARPTNFKAGELRAIRKADPSGRIITTYVGDPNACWDQFNPPIRYARRFNTAGAR
jgi:hypothetical protein